ncbi:hypothetical protein BaRGS_00033432 [Batillaria attramentaria]|uniref:Transposase n=1 Tax=Batillaria attramentaria TaxID=370345 RepID=A0ABD0JKS0_9CAEN
MATKAESAPDEKPGNLKKCVDLLQRAETDNEKLAALLLVPKIVTAEKCTAKDRQLILESIELSFLTRLLKTRKMPDGCPPGMYRSVALSVLSSLPDSLEEDTGEAIQWLATQGLLKNTQLCHVCGNNMTVGTFNGHLDGKRWRCPGACNVTKTISILLLYFWSADFPQGQVTRELQQSRPTVTDWSNFIREVCKEDLRLHPQQVGGLDEVTGQPIIVEIDETKYFHRKYHRGQWREGHWVFGGIEWESGKCFMVEVPDRSRATLEPIVLHYILPGSRIIPDGWRAYGNLAQVGGGIYLHDVIGA